MINPNSLLPAMLETRKARAEDFNKILELYKKVAVIPLGLARNVSEISAAYIQGFMDRATVSGIELVTEHPDNKGEIIAEIHCYTAGIQKFSHVMGELTIAVAPDFQGKGIGKLIFTQLLTLIENEKPGILRVELIAQESNTKAIHFYERLGFKQEGRLEKRIRMNAAQLEADIPMAWFNKNYEM